MTLTVVERAGRAGDPALDLAVAHALAKRVSAGAAGEMLHVYRPSVPVVAFGRRDTRLPGFGTAVAAVRRAGFQPLVRATGGRAVAYTTEALVLDHVAPAADAMQDHEERFRRFGAVYGAALRTLGIDARVGAVPGEYCPGAQSVNARGTVKLVGTAQRVVKGAWLFSSLVVVGDHGTLRPLLTDVYASLGQPFDPASVGSVSGEAPGLDVDTVRAALLATYGARESGVLDEATLSLARELVATHRVLD